MYQWDRGFVNSGLQLEFIGICTKNLIPSKPYALGYWVLHSSVWSLRCEVVF